MSEEAAETVVSKGEGESVEAPPEAAPSSHEAEIDRLKGMLATAVARYREAVLAQSPDVPSELVKGDTIEAVDASLKVGRELVGKVRERQSASGTEARVPAGSPPRRPADVSALSPFEKIAHGLAKTG